MDVILPPPQYDHPPKMQIVEWIRPPRDVDYWCSTTQLGKGHWLGCSGVIKGICYIMRIDDADVARHERAHCNGWGGDHPGGVTLTKNAPTLR